MTNESILARLRTLISLHDPCSITGEGANARCAGKSNGYVPCCQGCRHLTARGCGLDSVPGCLFYFCVSAWERLPLEVQTEIKALGAAYQGAARLRGTEEAYNVSRGFSLPYVWNKGDRGPRAV